MITVRLSGGIGNQMFQYSLGRVLSIKNSTPLILNTEAYLDQTSRPFKKYMAVRKYTLSAFNIKARIAVRNEIPFIYRMYGKGKLSLAFDAMRRRIFRHKGYELSFKGFNPKILELKGGVYLDGYWQSPKYFAGFEDVIRKDFTFKNKFSDNIENLKKEIESQNSVCVHIRRGDYVNNSFYESVQKEYYDKGIAKIKSSTKIDKIYVFSDDIKWCEENLTFDFPVMFVGKEYAGAKDEGHLALMSTCKHFVICNSTFSWWGAYLSDYHAKIVIVPQRWFTDKNINESDLIPEEWIRI